MSAIVTPKEITLCKDSGIETASFGYYDGLHYAKEKGLQFGTEFSDVRKGSHYIVCCGDVMVKVESTDYPEIKRREI